MFVVDAAKATDDRAQEMRLTARVLLPVAAAYDDATHTVMVSPRYER